MAQNNLYSSRHVARIFGVVLETIRNWSDEFADYLSPTARPGKGKHRMYSQEDLRVFALVADQRKQGMTYDEIHMALDNGQRGELPSLPPDEVQALLAGEHGRFLTLEVDYLQQSIVKLQEQLKAAEAELATVHAIKEEKIRLEVKLESELQRTKEREERIEELRSDLSKAQQRIEDLLREVGQSYAKGIMEGMKARGELNHL